MMNEFLTMTPEAAKTRQGGWGLLEVLVSITIGAFVIAGLFSLLYNLTLASSAHSGLATLEDNERVALMAIQNVVETAGYMPENYYFTTAATQPTVASGLPVSNAPADAPSPGFTTNGQFLYGTSGSSGAPSDTLFVRYVAGTAASGSDLVSDCVGRTFTTGSIYGYPFSAKFSVDSSGNLICTAYDGGSTTGTAYTIASGLSTSSSAPGLQVYYGVDNSGTPGSFTGSATEYLPASAMSNYWYFSSTGNFKSYVRSIKFTLNFVNPLYNTAHTGSTNNYNSGQALTRSVSLIVFLSNSPT